MWISASPDCARLFTVYVAGHPEPPRAFSSFTCNHVSKRHVKLHSQERRSGLQRWSDEFATGQLRGDQKGVNQVFVRQAHLHGKAAQLLL